MRGVLLAAAVVALLPQAAPARVDAGRPPIRFADQGRLGLVVTAPGYTLRLTREGRFAGLVDRGTGVQLLRPEGAGCLWAVEPGGDPCRVRPRIRWNAASATLRLTYDRADVTAVATLRADRTFFDLRLRLENRLGAVVDGVSLPGGLAADTAAVEAGYAPNVLPGVKLGPGFFTAVGANVYTYPGRWAFTDFLALDVGRGHLALSTVNPEPDPIRPVRLGFVHGEAPDRCSGRTFCIRHEFQTWIPHGAGWSSPLVRIHVGRSVEEAIAAHRVDNALDRYASLEAKVGPRLDVLARAPLVKLDVWKAARSFGEWSETLRGLPSPSLLHPVAYTPRGHDENSPDFLPPDERFGTTADFRAAVEQAQALGHLVMPYLNVSWWDNESPTVQRVGPRDLSVHDAQLQPVIERYGERSGYLVSPHVGYVRDRVDGVMEEWRSDVPADCLFFDQIGARDWRRDFNPASPTTEAYYDGWLEAFAPFGDRCLMAEDGWDRLAASFAAFHGSLLMMNREHGLPDRWWGKGNWTPYPLATWLLHDKVLLYQHDLYDETFAVDAEVLTWNAAFGLVHSWEAWTRPLDDPWLELATALQQTLGPSYAGRPLTGYRELPGGVTESTFGDLVVTADWTRERFLARTPTVTAGIVEGELDGVTLSPGPHALVIERRDAEVSVRQPIGTDTPLAVPLPSSWRPGGTLAAVAIGRRGDVLGNVAGALRGDRFVFEYARRVGGEPVASYRVA